MTTFSAIIPTYNRSASVARAIESALAQTHPPLEVLVCDDGSTDETAATVEAFAERDRRVQYLPLQAHAGGPGAARNAGIRNARGRFVAFLDDDDTWEPGFLQSVLVHLMRDQGLVAGANAILPSGRLYFDEQEGDVSISARELAFDNPMITSATALATALARSIGGFSERRDHVAHEDWLMWLALADRGARFVRLATSGVRYQSEGAARLSSQPLKMQRGTVRIAVSRWRERPQDPIRALAVAVHASRLLKLSLRGRVTR